MRQSPLAVALSLLLVPLAWPINAWAQSPPQSMVTGGISPAPKDKKKANNDVRQRVQDAARRKAQQEAARRKAQADAQRKAQQEAARRKAQADARRKTQQQTASRESTRKTIERYPSKVNLQPVPFKTGNRPQTEPTPVVRTKNDAAIKRPSLSFDATFAPPPPSTTTSQSPWFLNSSPRKKGPLSELGSETATTVCWWEPEPSPVININVHLGSGFHCWTPLDHHHWWFGGGWHWHHHASTCHSFGWGFLCWSRPGCHTLGWRPWWDRPNCVEWWTPTWTWCQPSVHYVTLPPLPPPSSQECWDALNVGDLGLARRDFLRRLAADPFDADSRLGLALCEGLRGNASGMQAELLRVLENDPWVCMSWKPASLRDQLKELLRDASQDANRVDVPERWVVVGVLAAVAQEDGVALAALHRAFAHRRNVPGTELLHRMIQERQLAF